MKHLVQIAILTFGAMTIKAQTPEVGSAPDPYPAYPPASSPSSPPVNPSYPPPAPPSSPPLNPYSSSAYGSGPYGYDSYGPLGRAATWAGAVTIPYAFNWNAVGISAELGGLWLRSHFFGGEISYYNSESQRYNVYSNGTYTGHFYSSQEVTTVDFAYRYFAPLWGPGTRSPVTFYVGASGGVGFVNYSNNGSAFGFQNGNDGRGNFTGELLAGLQFNAGPFTSFRLGYRYITVNDAWKFDQHVNLNSSAIEGGLVFHF